MKEIKYVASSGFALLIIASSFTLAFVLISHLIFERIEENRNTYKCSVLQVNDFTNPEQYVVGEFMEGSFLLSFHKDRIRFNDLIDGRDMKLLVAEKTEKREQTIFRCIALYNEEDNYQLSMQQHEYVVVIDWKFDGKKMIYESGQIEYPNGIVLVFNQMD